MEAVGKNGSMRNQALQKITEVIALYLDKEAWEIQLNQRLRKDLRMTGVERFLISVGLEEDFNIEIPDAEVEIWRIVNDIVASVYKRIVRK